MSIAPRQAWTVEEFLNWEDQQPERWELINGHPWRMMVGAPYSHNMLVQNVWRALDRQLKPRGCTVHAETLKVRTRDAVYYPDVFVRCGPIDDIHALVIEDAVMAVEVLSPSTEKVDLTVKSREYFTMPALKHYVAVHQVPRRLDLFASPAKSLFAVAWAEGPGERLLLEDLDVELAFDEVFEGLPEDLSGR